MGGWLIKDLIKKYLNHRRDYFNRKKKGKENKKNENGSSINCK